MKGVAISAALRERARQCLALAMKDSFKDTSIEIIKCLAESFEAHQAFILYQNDVNKYLDKVNDRIKELLPDKYLLVLSDEDENTLKEIGKEHYNELCWTRFVYEGLITFIPDAKNELQEILSILRVLRIKRPARNIPRNFNLKEWQNFIRRFIQNAVYYANKYPNRYFAELYMLMVNDLCQITLKKENTIQKVRMEIPLNLDTDYLRIGPKNLTMPYCKVPELLNAFKDKITIYSRFMRVCEALAYVSHTSQYTRTEAMEFAKQQEAKRLKIDKTP